MEMDSDDERGEAGVAVDSRQDYRGSGTVSHLQRSGLSLAMPPKSQRRTGLPWRLARFCLPGLTG